MAMLIKNPHHFLCEVVRALGLDPVQNRVKRVTIDVPVNDFATATVIMNMRLPGSDRFVEVVRRYQWIEVNPDSGNETEPA